MASTLPKAYRNRFVGTIYDGLNAVLWLPTGSQRMRGQFVDRLGLRPDDRVLELGCGTGQVTEQLVATGAAVTAVDRSRGMLDVAHRRVPGATFVEGDATEAAPAGPVAVVVMAFLLHELEESGRRQLLAAACDMLRPGGRLAILDWSLPSARLRRLLWHLIVRAIEPNGAADVLGGCLPDELHRAGFAIVDQHAFAGGRASGLTGHAA